MKSLPRIQEGIRTAKEGQSFTPRNVLKTHVSVTGRCPKTFVNLVYIVSDSVHPSMDFSPLAVLETGLQSFPLKQSGS